MVQEKEAQNITLAQVQNQFIQWRQHRSPGRRIPQELWAAAVTLAERMPASKVAKALRLGYTDLCKHIDHQKNREQASLPIPFLELPGPIPAGGPHPVVAMENRRGDILRIYCSANQPLDLMSLTRTFLEARP